MTKYNPTTKKYTYKDPAKAESYSKKVAEAMVKSLNKETSPKTTQ